uniref:Uncharacterized protein n=1 Tax=viral metagenome TaxID=1070528 RepID=A0A6C0H8S0_9ZZZZ
MIVEHIKKFIYDNPTIIINITLCNNNYNFMNTNKTIKININYTHTLVKKDGRDTSVDTPYGEVEDEDNNKYLVRIEEYEELNESNIVIDYSIPNIINANTCELFNNFSKKYIYISSSIYDTYFIKDNRHIPILTTFIDTSQPRRATLLSNIYNLKLPHINVNNCFNKDDLQILYKNTKIMINIHQTSEHHTFEELRVLPALECGIITICENSPLSESIPYHDYIIWSSYDNIIQQTIEVLNNYDYYHDLIFVNEKTYKLSEFHNINYFKLSNSIKQHL